MEGCYAELRDLKEYHQRYKICEFHLKVSSIVRDDQRMRFCQQCGRFHLLDEFDGDKRCAVSPCGSILTLCLLSHVHHTTPSL